MQLKQINCTLQLGPSATNLKEYEHSYTDGGVESFVAVPETDLPFHVRITSSGYIAPGLAAYVFMDGQYQCNRSRQRLQIPAPGMSPTEYEIDLVLRQREEKTSEGHFIAREWSFGKLKTETADNAPDTNPVFAQNVGTIEVVILRCKDTGPLPLIGDGVFTAPTGPAPPSSAKASRAPSVRKSESTAAAKAHVKASSKAAVKPPTKVSEKKASEAGDTIGGLVGLFDGAGDDPDDEWLPANYFMDQTPLPGHRWDTQTSVYRYFPSEDPFIDLRNSVYRDDRSRVPRDPYAPKPFTVHGGHKSHHADHRYQQQYRPRTAGDHYAQPMSPTGRYDFQQRRRIPQVSPRHSPEVIPRRQERYDELRLRPVEDTRAHVHDGLKFVVDLCKQIGDIYKLAYEKRKKAAVFQTQAEMYQDDPELRLDAVKAQRQKDHEIKGLYEEANALFESIFARMRRMDRAEWESTRDYLVLETRLLPGGHPELEQWQDPRFRRYPTVPASQSGQDQRSHRSNAAADDGWQEQGQGNTGQTLWERKTQGQSNGQAPSERRSEQKNAWGSGDDIDGNKKDDWNNDNNNDWGGDQQEQENGGWGTNDDQGKQDNANANGSQQGNGWDNQDDQNKDNNGGGDNSWGNQQQESGNDAWGEKKQDDNAGWGGGGSKSNKKSSNRSNKDDQGDAWGNNNQKDGAGGWGETKSQTHGSKVGKWDDGKGKSQPRSGSSRAHTSSSRSSRLEPVIKPYWTEWDRADDNARKQRPKPRDAYEYPAPPAPAIPGGRANSVSCAVQAGRGANYAHQTLRPDYLDTMDRPYAIFTFKYRSKGALEKIIKRKIDTREVRKAVEEAEKEKLMRKPKDELVEEMMKRMRMPPPQSSKSRSASEKPASKEPSNKGWGGDEVKPRDSVSRRDDNGGWGGSKKSSQKGSGDGWGGGNDNGGGWPTQSEHKSASRGKSQAGGNSWGALPSHKTASKGKFQNGGGWAADDGGGNAWGAGNNAGGGAWAEDKGSKSVEHFAGEGGLKNTQDTQEKPSQSWANAGW